MIELMKMTTLQNEGTVKIRGSVQTASGECFKAATLQLESLCSLRMNVMLNRYYTVTTLNLSLLSFTFMVPVSYSFCSSI